MSEFDEKINDSIPEYMKKVCDKYDLKCEKLPNCECVLYNKNCCLITQIGYYNISILYVRKEKKELCAYRIDDFIGQRFDAVDRRDMIEGKGREISLRNDLIIFASGFITKCEDLFTGDERWFIKYKESSRYSKVRIEPETMDYLIKIVSNI